MPLSFLFQEYLCPAFFILSDNPLSSNVLLFNTTSHADCHKQVHLGSWLSTILIVSSVWVTQLDTEVTLIPFSLFGLRPSQLKEFTNSGITDLCLRLLKAVAKIHT